MRQKVEIQNNRIFSLPGRISASLAGQLWP
jgi:hypothetical protein